MHFKKWKQKESILFLGCISILSNRILRTFYHSNNLRNDNNLKQLNSYLKLLVTEFISFLLLFVLL